MRALDLGWVGREAMPRRGGDEETLVEEAMPEVAKTEAATAAVALVLEAVALMTKSARKSVAVANSSRYVRR